MLQMFLLSFALVGQLKVYPVEFVECYDGDTCTFHILLETRTTDMGMGIEEVTLVKMVHQKVRLCDISAPEIRPLKTRAEATKSRDQLVAWINDAKRLELWMPQKKCGDHLCGKKGKYGRWLGYVFADGINLNAKMVEAGLATSYALKCE
jgi:endonuclease YncB( thermonuclease family)